MNSVKPSLPSLWVLAAATAAAALRGVAEHLWGNDGLLYTVVDAGSWAVVVVLAAVLAHRAGYRQARDRYKTKLDDLTAILPGHGPVWDAWLKGKKVGARSMQHRATALSCETDAEAIRALPLVFDPEWVDATEESPHPTAPSSGEGP